MQYFGVFFTALFQRFLEHRHFKAIYLQLSKVEKNIASKNIFMVYNTNTEKQNTRDEAIQSPKALAAGWVWEHAPEEIFNFRGSEMPFFQGFLGQFHKLKYGKTSSNW